MNESGFSVRPCGTRSLRLFYLPLTIGLGLLPLLLLALAVPPASAGGSVTNCTDAGLTAALAGGGLVTFSCPANPFTITVTSQKVITQPTLIDGGSLGQVILSGGHLTRTFAVQAGASLSLENLVIRDGSENDHLGGGAILFLGDSLALTNTLFISNTSPFRGGAILMDGAAATIADSTFMFNRGTSDSSEGGAIYVNFGRSLITNSAFHDNQAGHGGALYNFGPLTMVIASLYANYATSDGGAIQNFGPAWLTSVSIHDNTAAGAGGNGYGGGLGLNSTDAIVIDHAQIFANRVITGNPQFAGGGLALFNGVLTLTNSSVYSNVVDAGPGGGIHASYGAALTVVNSAIYANQAAGEGGGIDVRTTAGFSPTSLSLVNSTVSSNSASKGGGLSTDPQTSPLITNATFDANNAAAGKELSGSVAIINSIIAGGGNLNCTGSVNSGGWNIDDGNSCGLAGIADFSNTDPMLGPLAANGGPSLTQALLPGSPAIDLGLGSACPPTDQRGALRSPDVDGAGGCDTGAYEFQAFVNWLYLPLVRR